MHTLINTKTLRLILPDIIRQVQRGKKFTVLYRSRPAFGIVPLEEEIEKTNLPTFKEDSLYQAKAVGFTRHAGSAEYHDDILYG